MLCYGIFGRSGLEKWIEILDEYDEGMRLKKVSEKIKLLLGVVGYRRGIIIIEVFYYYFVLFVMIFFDDCMIYVFL